MTPWKFLTCEYTHWALENRAANTVASQNSAINMGIEKYLPKKSIDLNDVTPEMVSCYINAEDGVGLGQRRFRLSAVNSFLSLAKDRGHCKGNVAAKLRVNMKNLTLKQKEPKKKKPFSLEEYKLTCQGIDVLHKAPVPPTYLEFFKFATTLSYYTGLRLSDCASLEWDSIVSVPNHLVVWTAKAGDKQHARVALPVDHDMLGGGELVKLFNGLDFGDDPDYVWPEERRLISTPSTRSYLPQYYKRMLKKIPTINGRVLSFHCLRHSFVTRLKAAGVGLEDIGKLVAHTSTGTTEIYNHA